MLRSTIFSSVGALIVTASVTFAVVTLVNPDAFTPCDAMPKAVAAASVVDDVKQSAWEVEAFITRNGSGFETSLDSVVPAESGDNSVVISGLWPDYVITGSSPLLGASTYVLDSEDADGNYTFAASGDWLDEGGCWVTGE